jgi:hypothetical protein
MASAMTGLGRVFWHKNDAELQLVPVDFVANLIIAATSKAIAGSASFYNSTASVMNPMTLKDLMKFFHKLRDNTPAYEKLFWFPRYRIKSNFVSFTSLFIVKQIIPAILFDFCMVFCLKKPL